MSVDTRIMICQHQDVQNIQKAMGSYVHLDDVDIPAIWNICRDGVDNFAPDMVQRSECAEGVNVSPALHGERRTFEINRRVVDALNAMIYSYTEDSEDLGIPESFRDQDYDAWVGEHDQLVSLYQMWKCKFIVDEEYDAPQVYRALDGTFYTWMGGVKYNLAETGETRPC